MGVTVSLNLVIFRRDKEMIEEFRQAVRWVPPLGAKGSEGSEK